MSDAIKDKIRKLLAVGTEGSGATEDEAETAMRLAAALMAKHGIAADTLGPQAAANATSVKPMVDG